MSKLLFVDSNIFIRECLEKHSAFDFLHQLSRILESQDVVLVMPEITKNETLRQIKEKADSYIATIQSQELAKSEPSLSEHLKNEQIKIIKQKQKTASDSFIELSSHAKVLNVSITNDLILSGLTRQLRNLAPSIKKSGKPEGVRSVVDHDSLAFESILMQIRIGTHSEVIFCTEDNDYYLNKDKCILKPSIDEEIRAIPGIVDVLAFTDAVSLVTEKFGASLAKEAKVKMTRFWEYPTPFNEVQTDTPLPGSILKGETLNCLYWFGSDGNRYTIQNEDILRTWFPESAPQPVIYQITDSVLASIPLGGNILYRAGSRLIKIKSDPKIYVVGNEGSIHWIESENTIEQIFGFHWRDLLVIIPDALFVDYYVGQTIESAADFDPQEVKRLDRLP